MSTSLISVEDYINRVSMRNNNSSTSTSTVFSNVGFCKIIDDRLLPAQSGILTGVRVELNKTKEPSLKVYQGNKLLEQISLGKDQQSAKIGRASIVVASNGSSCILQFFSHNDMNLFENNLKCLKKVHHASVFNERTDQSSASCYFESYGQLSMHQMMLEDDIRTSTYQKAMLDNMEDFKNKVVIDVGTGTGILAFFAVQAGASRVYAIEASNVAKHCQTLVNNNKLGDKIKVICGKVEDVVVPELVDVIVSEPMGYMLLNERMLETYLHARKWLKPTGKMFPTIGDLHIAPFTDETLYNKINSKASLWRELKSYNSVDFSCLCECAVEEYMARPIVESFDETLCMARNQIYTVDFMTAVESDLHNISIPLSFTAEQSDTIHGLALWFKVAFIGSQSTVWLSTSPADPDTHWHQVRCPLPKPFFVEYGQKLSGHVILNSNLAQSYNMEISLGIPGTSTWSSNVLDLNNTHFPASDNDEDEEESEESTSDSPAESCTNINDSTTQSCPNVNSTAESCPNVNSAAESCPNINSTAESCPKVKDPTTEPCCDLKGDNSERCLNIKSCDDDSHLAVKDSTDESCIHVEQFSEGECSNIKNHTGGTSTDVKDSAENSTYLTNVKDTAVVNHDECRESSRSLVVIIKSVKETESRDEYEGDVRETCEERESMVTDKPVTCHGGKGDASTQLLTHCGWSDGDGITYATVHIELNQEIIPPHELSASTNQIVQLPVDVITSANQSALPQDLTTRSTNHSILSLDLAATTNQNVIHQDLTTRSKDYSIKSLDLAARSANHNVVPDDLTTSTNDSPNTTSRLCKYATASDVSCFVTADSAAEDDENQSYSCVYESILTDMLSDDTQNNLSARSDVTTTSLDNWLNIDQSVLTLNTDQSVLTVNTDLSVLTLNTDQSVLTLNTDLAVLTLNPVECVLNSNTDELNQTCKDKDVKQ